MNEELKIIINAVTDGAKKSIEGVKKELGGVEKASGKGGKALAAMGKVAKGAAVAVAAIGAALVGVIAALTKVSESTKEYRQSMSQLTSAYQSMGSSAAQAQKTYKELYRFMGETDTAVEASNLLAKLTTDEQKLAQWTKTLQGVYATFPDSLPIESLVEASNETARVGKVTGTLADALNWAGENEDAFNQKLAATNSLSEREALIRETLSGLYDDAAELYEKNAANILAQNEAQDRLNQTLAKIGETTTPLVTALANLSNALLNLLAPAINAITPHLVNFINWITKAVNWVNAFFTALTGKKKVTEVPEQVAAGMQSVANAANSAASGIDAAKDSAEALKRATAGFDELNVISSGSSSSGSSGGNSGGGGGGATTITPEASGAGEGLTDAFEESSKSAEKFVKKLKDIFNDIKTKVKDWAQLFNPSIEAWKGAFEGLKEPVSNAFVSIGETYTKFKEETLAPFAAYLNEEYIPELTNNFSENFAPIFTDVASWAVTQFADDFEWMAERISLAVEDIIKPALETFKQITTDTTDAVGKEWEESGNDFLENLTGVIDSFKSIWDNLYNNVILPIWEAIVGFIQDLWDNHLKGLWENLLDFFSSLWDCITTLWNNFLAPIVNWLITVLAPIVTNVIQTIINVVGTVIGIIVDVVSGILKALSGLLDFITGVFSGDWKKAWEGIKKFFGGIWDAIWGIIKGVINLIIDGINSLWTGIYSVIKGLVDGIGSIAGAIGNILGKDWKFSMPKKAPTIPKLATGGIVNSATIAMIGERGKEAVLPLENNTEWMDKLAAKLGGNSTPSKIVLMLDGKELGYATINSINNITRQTGSLQLALI